MYSETFQIATVNNVLDVGAHEEEIKQMSPRIIRRLSSPGPNGFEAHRGWLLTGRDEAGCNQPASCPAD